MQGVLYLNMRSLLVLAALLVAAAAELVEPGEKALELNEEEFEQYLDAWLEQEQSRSPNAGAPPSGKGCTFRVNGDLGQPQPVYLRGGNRYLTANGNTGLIQLNNGERVVIACTGQAIRNVAGTQNVATVTCVNNNLVSGGQLFNGLRAFGQLTCTSHLQPVFLHTTDRCWNNHRVIRVGFNVGNAFYPLYGSCFDEQNMQVLYVWYEQTPQHAVHQTRVSRPTWQSGNFFSNIDVSTTYSQNHQRAVFTNYFGSTLANNLITRHKQRFLARGHLAAKSDFVFATAQRATFHFINAAPQWQCINAGNWNRLEQNLRARIGAAGYYTIIYTGTYGVLKLRNGDKGLVDIYLSQSKIPVPLYFYKVAYDASSRKGTAFITINNPHFTTAEAAEYAHAICTDRCRGNRDFDWLRWQPDRVEIGYSFCCTVEDFRGKISHLPRFPTDGGLLS